MTLIIKKMGRNGIWVIYLESSDRFGNSKKLHNFVILFRVDKEGQSHERVEDGERK